MVQRRAWMALVWLALLLPVAAYAEEANVVVEADVLNVRIEPWGEKIGSIYRGQQFTVRERRGDWGRIEYQFGQLGWVALDYTQPYAPPLPAVSPETYCGELNAEFDRLGWAETRCSPADWKTAGASVMGRPLFYNDVGAGSTVSMLVCGVHSDENTPYQCFKLYDLLKENPALLVNRLVIVPLINPDGFLQEPKTRTNAHGVDLNRNLPTSDWHVLALQSWASRYQQDSRRYPGPEANSEPENRFLLDLVKRYRPDKIISIHSPLNFLDLDFLDAPADNTDLTQISKNAADLAGKISKGSNFRFRDYNTFPGSLGRYGNEWRIPIYTLELPNANPRQSAGFFDRFKKSLVYSFNVILDVHKTAMVNAKPPAVN